MTRLVAASNRVTRADGDGARAGGLAVGLLAALKETEGLWFGWSGNIADAPSEEPRHQRAGTVSYATMDLSQDDYDQYYNGYSNSTLWPLLHYRVDLANFHRNDYAGYRRVNRRFAHALAKLLRDDDLVWIHDYHMIPMAEELRALGVTNRIGFFLHTPFPAEQIFITLPNHREIAGALSAYDVAGFQSQTDVRMFQQYVAYEAGGQIGDDGWITMEGRTFRVGAFPIGIDTENIENWGRNPRYSAQIERMKQSLRGRALIIGVDRLDYSKGQVARFEAFERLLEAYPEHVGQVVLLQIAPPSREDVAQYSEIRHMLEATSGHINGRFAEFDWAPIRYLNRSVRREALVEFYRAARVGLVTPLRDGMNLVALEYVAAQDPADPGVLIVSRFAGAAEQLDSALVVNPYDQEHFAATIDRALKMPREERRNRWERAIEVIRKFDIAAWRQSFLDELSRTRHAA